MTSSFHVIEGMEVRDTHAAPVGQVQQVLDSAVLVRLQQDIYVPLEAIDAVTDECVVLDVQTATVTPATPSGSEAAHRDDGGQVCSACGGVAERDATPFLYRGDARFCADCWRHLPAHDVERVVCEVALRGVPIS